MSDLPELSKAEHSVASVLWKHGPLSVREVHNQLHSETHWAYTTTKTVMDRMVNKSLLAREKFHGVNLYKAVVSRPRGLARMVHYFARQVLNADYDSVIAMFSGKDSISDSERAKLRALLKQLDKESQAKND